MDVSRGFGERLKTLRKAKGLTQLELAGVLGVTPVTVCRWERGDMHPNTSRVERAADALGVKRAWLLWGEGAVPRIVGGDHA